MNKVFSSIQEAVSDIQNSSVILIGGFTGSGNPYYLIEAVAERNLHDLTIVGVGPTEWLRFVEKGQARKVISGATTTPFRADEAELIDRQIQSGKLEAEAIPLGTLAERVRAGGAGIAAFYVMVGAGTKVEQGKETREFDGQRYILEKAIKADFALIKGYKADPLGNVVCRLAALSHTLNVAMCARVTIAEVEEIVPVGQIEPERVNIPGIFVHRVVRADKFVRWRARGTRA